MLVQYAVWTVSKVLLDDSWFPISIFWILHTNDLSLSSMCGNLEQVRSWKYFCFIWRSWSLESWDSKGFGSNQVRVVGIFERRLLFINSCAGDFPIPSIGVFLYSKRAIFVSPLLSSAFLSKFLMLCLTIQTWITRAWCSVCKFPIRCKTLKLMAIKLRSIVWK